MFSPTQIHSFKIELKKTYEIRSLSNLASLKVTDTHSIIFCLTKQYVFVKIHFIIVLRSQTVQNNFRIQSLTHQFQINYDNKMQLWVGDVRRMDAVTFSRKYFQKKTLASKLLTQKQERSNWQNLSVNEHYELLRLLM